MTSKKPNVMKTKINLLSTVGFLSLIIFAFSLFTVLPGCKKETTDTSKKPYSNKKDDSTTSIQLNIPRIELNPLKSTEIKLYLSVTDQNGHPFTEFNQYNFTIKQVCVGETDTAAIASLTFTKLNESGNNIAPSLVLDYSGSMTSYIPDLETAVSTFINLKEANDQMSIIKFSSYVEQVLSFTADKQKLLDSLLSSWPGAYQSTAFYDALGLGLQNSSAFINTHTTFMPALIGFTDGLDNDSYQYNYQSIIDEANQQQIPIYTIGFGDADSTTLKYVSESTGGRFYYTPDATYLQTLYSLISGQLQNIYVVKWNYTNTSCTQVLVEVTSSYTCKNGTFHSKVEKTFFPLKK